MDSDKRILILLAIEGEWAGRSFESVLEANGYMVLRCQSGRRALELWRDARPHAIILDETLPELSGMDVTRALRADPLFDPATPIIITATAATRRQREALVAGAWEYCVQPIDTEVLLLKLATFLRAKQESDDWRARSLVDKVTGLYNAEGLNEWARRLGARAVRGHEAFACVAIDAELSVDATHAPEIGMSKRAVRVAELWRANSRRSDVIGHLDAGRLAILAPETDGRGASQLVERLRGALEQVADESGQPSVVDLRAGYCAYDDLAAAGVEPREILRRAERALAHAASKRVSGPAVAFDQLV
jgi:PleD family two-component response regulator